MPNKDDWRWVFGLSIDDELTWSATRTNIATGDLSENPAEILQGLLPYPSNKGIVDLQEYLRRELIILKDEHPIIFEMAEAVGVSVIGIVDHEKNLLLSIARKNWKSHENEVVVDFNRLFHVLFKRKIKISVQNDATAKCLAEYYWINKAYRDSPSTEQQPPDSLFYGLFHEGVNGGFVNGSLFGGEKPIASLLHQEMGHIIPLPHERDARFNLRYRGCPIHKACFESIASSARVEKQWGKPLQELRDHKDNPWDIIAHYISHFCWNIVLTIPPNKIVLGGSIIFPELVELVREKFWHLNTGGTGKPYIQYRELLTPDFIANARVPRGAEGQAGALNLARRTIINKPLHVIDPLKDRGQSPPKEGGRS